MINLECYVPRFFGKDASEKLNTWNVLLSEKNYEELLLKFNSELRHCIAELRKAEILEDCQIAAAALSQLKTYFQWDESYLNTYCLDVTLTHSADNADEFRAYALGQSDVSTDWVQQEIGTAEIVDWGLGTDPSNVNVMFLALREGVGHENEPAATPCNP